MSSIEEPNQPDTSLEEVTIGSYVIPLDDDNQIVIGGPDELDVPFLKVWLSDAEFDSIDTELRAAGVIMESIAQYRNQIKLVRLLPKTVNEIKSGLSPMVGAGGENLGVLMNESGKIASHVKWAQVSKVTSALSSLGSLSTGLALMQMQAQLGRIEAVVSRTLDVAKEIKTEILQEHWNRIMAINSIANQLVLDARANGEVNVQLHEVLIANSYYADLISMRAQQVQRIASFVNKMPDSKSLKERSIWLAEYGQDIVRSLSAAWYSLDAQRDLEFLDAAALYAGAAGELDDKTKRTIQALASQSEPREAQFVQSLIDSLDTLQTTLRSWEVGPGSGDKTDKAHIVNQATAINSAVTKLRKDPLSRTLGVAPGYRPYVLEYRDKYRKWLSGSLRSGEKVLINVPTKTSTEGIVEFSSKQGSLVVTNQRIIHLLGETIEKHGKPQWSYPLENFVLAEWLNVDTHAVNPYVRLYFSGKHVDKLHLVIPNSSTGHKMISLLRNLSNEISRDQIIQDIEQNMDATKLAIERQ